MMRAVGLRFVCLCVLSVWVPANSAMAECKEYVGIVCLDKPDAEPETKTTDRPAAAPKKQNVTPASKKPQRVEDWDTYDWDEMTAAQRRLWSVLGWDAARWRGASPKPESDDMEWEDLSNSQRAAAAKLGFSAKTWNAR